MRIREEEEIRPIDSGSEAIINCPKRGGNEVTPKGPVAGKKDVRWTKRRRSDGVGAIKSIRGWGALRKR